MSGYQFSPFEIGQIKAHAYHGLGAAAIARLLVKADGKNHWSDKAVQNALDKLESHPKWRGERRKGSMRPRKTSIVITANYTTATRELLHTSDFLANKDNRVLVERASAPR